MKTLTYVSKFAWVIPDLWIRFCCHCFFFKLISISLTRQRGKTRVWKGNIPSEFYIWSFRLKRRNMRNVSSLVAAVSDASACPQVLKGMARCAWVTEENMQVKHSLSVFFKKNLTLFLSKKSVWAGLLGPPAMTYSCLLWKIKWYFQTLPLAAEQTNWTSHSRPSKFTTCISSAVTPAAFTDFLCFAAWI